MLALGADRRAEGRGVHSHTLTLETDWATMTGLQTVT